MVISVLLTGLESGSRRRTSTFWPRGLEMGVPLAGMSSGM